MEVFRCTVQVKQQLTKEACRYYIRHNHARSWTSPIYATITFFAAETAVLHIAWCQGIPAHSQVGRALSAFAYGFALFGSIFWLFFMPYSLRTAMFFRLRLSGTRLSEPFSIEITPQVINISPRQEILLRPFGDEDGPTKGRSRSRKIILAKVDRVHESQYGLYFTMRRDFRISLFISRDVMPPEEYGALCEMLKKRFQSRYYEI